MVETGYETPGRMSGATTRRSVEPSRTPAAVSGVQITKAGDGFAIAPMTGGNIGKPVPVGSLEEAVTMATSVLGGGESAPPQSAGLAPEPPRQESRPMNGSAYLAR